MTEYRGYTIRIFQEDSPESPRVWGTLGHILAKTHRSDFSDKDAHEGDLKLAHARGVVLPVYCYMHGCTMLSTKSFVGRAHQAAWDSDCIGVVYATARQIQKWFKVNAVTPEIREQASKVIAQEIEIYSQWVNGEVYGWTVEKSTSDDDVDAEMTAEYGEDYEPDTEIVADGGEVYGYCEAEKAAREAVDSLIAKAI